MKLILATRKSILAQSQTDYVMGLLKDKHNIECEKLLMSTEGDRRLDVTLDKIGGKGLFVKDIEYALLDKRAHAAVHSMKDVPFKLEDEFTLVSMPNREDVRDAFVSSNGIHFDELKKGAVIGTSSIRRAEQLKAIRSDLIIVPIRGNVQTRLRKMKENNLDGIILAAAGLKRLGMDHIITDYFDINLMVPAVGQGVLGIECLKECEYIDYFKAIDNINARHEAEAERSFMRALNGDCHSLIGAYAKLSGDDIYMIGTYSVNGKIVKKDISGSRYDRIELGESLAKKILSV